MLLTGRIFARFSRYENSIAQKFDSSNENTQRAHSGLMKAAFFVATVFVLVVVLFGTIHYIIKNWYILIQNGTKTKSVNSLNKFAYIYKVVKFLLKCPVLCNNHYLLPSLEIWSNHYCYIDQHYIRCWREGVYMQLLFYIFLWVIIFCTREGT